MVDVVGQALVMLAERVVRQLGQMHHRIELDDIGGIDVADILGQHRQMAAIVVERAVAVEAGIETGDLMAVVLQQPSEDCADIAVCAGDQDFHGAAVPVYPR